MRAVASGSWCTWRLKRQGRGPAEIERRAATHTSVQPLAPPQTTGGVGKGGGGGLGRAHPRSLALWCRYPDAIRKTPTSYRSRPDRATIAQEARSASQLTLTLHQGRIAMAVSPHHAFCTVHRIAFNTLLDPVCPQCVFAHIPPWKPDGSPTAIGFDDRAQKPVDASGTLLDPLTLEAVKNA